MGHCCSARDEENRIKTVANPTYLPHCEIGQSLDLDSPGFQVFEVPDLPEMNRHHSVKNPHRKPLSSRHLQVSNHGKSKKSSTNSNKSTSSSSCSHSRRPIPFSSQTTSIMKSHTKMEKAFREGKVH